MLGGQYFRSHKPSRKRHYDDFCFGITDHQEAAFVDVVRYVRKLKKHSLIEHIMNLYR